MPEHQRPDLLELSRRIEIQNGNRALWELHTTPESLEQMFDEEHAEMIECRDNFFLKDLADFHMVSEVGDVGYLFLKYQASYGEPPKRMVTKLAEAISLASRCNFSMSDAVNLKLIRNSQKYPDIFSDVFNDYADGRRMSKELWEAMGGDNKFFEWYGAEYE